jgi:hypothetical protein
MESLKLGPRLFLKELSTMMVTFEEFEKQIMEKLLSGNDPNLEKLRTQYSTAEVKSRKFTGTGFYTNFQPDMTLPKVVGKQKFHFGDLKVDLKGVKSGVGFVLFIADGYINYLEGYTYDDPWPEVLDILNISFETSGKRNFEKLRDTWAF